MIASTRSGRRLSILVGNSTGFGTPRQIEVPRSIKKMAIGRLDSDDIPDVALLLDQGLVQTLLGDGAGGFVHSEYRQLGSSSFASFRSIAISEGLESEPGTLIVGVSNPNTVEVFSVAVDGLLGEPTTIELGFSPTIMLAEVFYGQGQTDVLIGSSRSVGILRKHSNQTFELDAQVLQVEDTNIQQLLIRDLNSDGLVDILALGNIDNQLGIAITTWIATEQEGFSAPRYFELGLQNSGITNFDHSDFDGDGTADILVNAYVDGLLNDINLVAITGIEQQDTDIGPKTFSYDSTFGYLTSQVDEFRRRIVFEIDPANGNRVSESRVVGELDTDSNSESDDLVTHYSYNSHGLVESMTDPMGRRTEYDYTVNGQLELVTVAVGLPEEATRRFEYDAVGNQTVSIDELGNRTEYEYDSMNRVVLIREADPDKGGPLTSPVSTFSYDANGNVVESVDAEGSANPNEFDSMNRLVASLDHFGNETTYEYGPDGNLISITDPLGLVSRNKYDARDRLVESIDPEGGRVEYSYDLSDNLMSLVDPVGNQTIFSYDSRDRLVREVDQLGNSTFYEYDLVDNLVRIRDRNNRLTQYSYDDIDRVVNEQWIASDDSSVDNTIDLSYDNASNLVEIADDFSRLTFGYDARDRVVSAGNSGTPNSPDVMHRYSYDAANNVLVVTDAIGGSERGITDYEYDALNRVVSVKQSGNDVSDKAVDFAYNQIGKFSEILRYSDLSSDSLVAHTAYSYDSINRLMDLEHIDLSGKVISFFNYSYDSSSRIASITGNHGETRYSYDDFSQIVSADRAPTDPRGDESYTYDSNGNRVGSHLHAENYETDAINRLRNDGVYSYEYDTEGNLTGRLNLETEVSRIFDWDHRNRLIRVTDVDDGGNILQTVGYTYDALDRRIAKSVDDDGLPATPAVITSFVYDGKNVALQFMDADGSEPTQQPRIEKRNLHGPAVDQILAEESAQGVSWALNDHLGSVSTVVTNDGVVIEDLAYDSFGNSAVTASGYGFTGREIDIETGLYYYRARYYDSSTGRFLSEDPIGFGASDANLYRYVFNNPISYTDPSGEIVPILAWGAAIFIGGFGVGAGIDASIQYYDKGCIDTSQVAKAGLLTGAVDVATLGTLKYTKLSKLLGRLVSKAPKGKALSAAQLEKLKLSYAADEILNANRVGSGLKSDVGHRAASYLSRKQLEAGKIFPIRGGDGVQRQLLQTFGELDGTKGVFEFVLDANGTITHQRFKVGGVINGVPN